MKIAIISDIHGNSWALESVLENIKAKQIDIIYDLGDSLYGPLDPLGTFRLFDQYGISSLAGNDDRLILENAAVINPTHTYVLDCLKNSNALQWLRSLPPTRIVNDNLLLCHGTPNDDNTYLLEDVKENGNVNVKNADTLEHEVKDLQESVILCGHSHIPGIVTVSSKTLVNAGSVGLQAYCAQYPAKHVMQTFCHLARYCVVDIADKICIEQIAINYNYEAAALCAEKNRRDDWAFWIRTGRAL